MRYLQNRQSKKNALQYAFLELWNRLWHACKDRLKIRFHETDSWVERLETLIQDKPYDL